MSSDLDKFVNDYDNVEDVFGNYVKKQKRKRAVNSNRKGKGGERKICDYLTEKFGKTFSRVPQSGAYGTTHGNLSEEATKLLSGDLICPTGFIAAIEVKTGYDIDLNNLFCSDNSYFTGKESDKKKIFEFIDQACRDAYRSKLIPMVIYSKDRRVPLAILPIVNHDRQLALFDFKPDIMIRFNYTPKKYELWSSWCIYALEELVDKLPGEFWFK